MHQWALERHGASMGIEGIQYITAGESSATGSLQYTAAPCPLLPLRSYFTATSQPRTRQALARQAAGHPGLAVMVDSNGNKAASISWP